MIAEGANGSTRIEADQILTDRGVVAIETVALADDVAVPVQPDGGEVCQLTCLVFKALALSIEILDPHEELLTHAAGR